MSLTLNRPTLAHPTLTLRRPEAADADVVGRLIFDAFVSIADRHRFPRDFPAAETAQELAQAWIGHPKVWGVVAELDGRIVGCNFLDERNSVPGVGPICIDPAAQGSGIGRRLMQVIIERGRRIGAPSVRLVQDAFNTVSMSLYASLGFEAKEPLALMQGTPAADPAAAANGSVARPMSEADLPACAALCREVHGLDRSAELAEALRQFRPFVLVRDGRIVAYASAPTFWILNHGVAATQQDMQDLLQGAATQSDAPLQLLVPIRNAALFRWCLARGLRMVKPMTLMALGDYREPRAVFFPSVQY
jgi:predicted N-acetyltransferase YhbS